MSPKPPKPPKPTEPIKQWRTNDRHYTLTTSTFTKRQLYPHEKRHKRDGSIITLPESFRRLENERDTLIFIANNTTIPVPKVLDFSIEDDGVAVFTTEAIAGVTASETELKLDVEDKAKLLKNILNFLDNRVLSQLQRLRSRKPGALGGKVTLPTWNKGTEDVGCFHFCHNDLAPQNVLVDPESLQVVALVDWEFAGYSKAEFSSRALFKRLWGVEELGDGVG